MVSVTWAWTELLPFSFPDFSASCTAFSIARYEVTPRCFKNLRISILSRSSFIGISIAELDSPEGYGELFKQKCDFLSWTDAI